MGTLHTNVCCSLTLDLKAQMVAQQTISFLLIKILPPSSFLKEA